jgi:hypothetical protein
MCRAFYRVLSGQSLLLPGRSVTYVMRLGCKPFLFFLPFSACIRARGAHNKLYKFLFELALVTSLIA